MNIDLTPTDFHILASLVDTSEDNVFTPYSHQDHVKVSGTSIYITGYIDTVERLFEKGLICKVANSGSIFISEYGKEYLRKLIHVEEEKSNSIYPQFKRIGDREISEGGLSKLDYFAGRCLSIVDMELLENFGCQDVVAQVYDLAEAMVEESNKRQS